jgi:hypothetical protein
LLAGERVTFRCRRQTASEPVLLDPMVFIGIVVRLFAPAFVLATSLPIAPVPVALLITRVAAPWSMGQCNLPCGLNRS